ncbi:MAG: asparagine synthase (glutamine-hydrolyzing) [Archangiaceae bacterium]|nr:asparagine synthase (glutamine-hydrolyzing) [Archangiaceae bacterium]
MCGIAGAVSPKPTDPEVFTRMAQAIAHRGPDDSGVFTDGPCGLAFRRLSIIDLSGGHQPMTIGPATVVFNGEIYNFRDLRRELEARGDVFGTHSDTEVLLRAYLAFGDQFLSRIDGMFALAIWDTRTRTLLLARDRFGKKPLYWFRGSDGTLVFGSEVKALLQHPAVPRALDPRALRRYLAFEYVPTPDCIFEGVRKLPEGHALTSKDGRVTEWPYYVLPAGEGKVGFETLVGLGVDEAAQTLRTELERAVERRLVSDVPLGIFLSGGIDSTAITALAARAAGKVKTFSISFSEGSFDESGFARLAAQRLGTEHHEERLSPQAALDLIPTLADQLDEPFADPSYVPTLLLSRFTRKHVTVALGGDGADELFAGYDTFLAHVPGLLAARLPTLAVAGLQRAAGLLPTGEGYMSLDFRLRTFLAGAHQPSTYRHQAWIGAMTPDRVNALLTPSLRGDDIYAPLDRYRVARSERGLDFVQRFYLSFYLRDDILVKVDRASMAASLEVRAPFLDTRVVELALSLPWLTKLRGTGRKWLLKRALRGVVPDEVLDRKKHGFAIPVTEWLKGPLRPLVEELLAEKSVREAGLFEPREVRRLIDEHQQGVRDHRKPLWTLLQLELWRRRWLTGAKAGAPARSAA